MKALVLEQYNQLVFKDVPTPAPGVNEVLIKVMACGICGSDVHGMDGSTGRRQPPLIMGHEASGMIESTGDAIAGWAPGDRVTFDSTIYPLNDWYSLRGMYNLSDDRRVLGVAPDEYKQHGAFAEYIVVPGHILYRIPDGVSFEHAAMVEPFAVAAHAMGLTTIELGDTVLVVGAGLIGLCLIQLLNQSLAGDIVVVDIDESRLEMARRFGASHCMQPEDGTIDQVLAELTEGRGADVAFEAVGISETLQTAVSSVRKGGTVTLIGNLAQNVHMPLQLVVTRQLKLQGSCAIRGEYTSILKLMEKKGIDPQALISVVAPLSEGVVWFQRLYNGEPDLYKVILKP